MCNDGKMRTTTLLTLTSLLILVSGCNTPKHSNVLIFATNTKFALDISYDPKMQEPNLTVGYKRQEGVWMPLLANTGDEGLEPGPITVTPPPTGGTAALSADGLLYRGNENNDKDTYSVLASFGAKWGAKGSSKEGAASDGGLAQYFATGLAARKLAEGGGAALVSTRAESPGSMDKRVIEAQIKANYDDLGTVAKWIASATDVTAKRERFKKALNGVITDSQMDATCTDVTAKDEKGISDYLHRNYTANAQAIQRIRKNTKNEITD